MYQSAQNRIDELKRIIENAQRELHHLEWTTKTQGHPSTWFRKAIACTMPQGHPYYCGCDW